MSERLKVMPQQSCPPAAPQGPAVLEVQDLTVTAGKRVILRKVNLRISDNQVYGLIGASGSGKSTLLKCLNRMIDLTPGLTVSGDVLFHGQSIWERSVRADDLRGQIGMLFQQPVVFPKSIYQNVIFGIRHLGVRARSEWPEAAERALREAAIWDEVKDRLRE